MDRLKLVVHAILESAAFIIAVMGAVTLMGVMMNRSAPLIDYVILIGSACAGLLMIAEFYAIYRRGWRTLRRSSALLVITALLISASLGVASIPVHSYPVEGSFHYEYRLTSNIRFRNEWNQTEPIDENTTATLGVRGWLTYGIMEEELATCDLIVVDRNDGIWVALNGDYGPQLWSLFTRNVKPPFSYRLSLSGIVNYLTEQGITDGLHNITFTLLVDYFLVHAPGLPEISLWSATTHFLDDFDHTLLTASLTMVNGTITGIHYDNQPLETTKTVLLYNPALLAVKDWIPPSLLVAVIMIQTVTYAVPHRWRILALIRGSGKVDTDEIDASKREQFGILGEIVLDDED